MNAELIDSRRSAAESRVLGMNAEVSTCRRADVSTWNAGVRTFGCAEVARVLGMNADVSMCRRADVSTWTAGVRMCGGVDVCVAVDC